MPQTPGPSIPSECGRRRSPEQMFVDVHCHCLPGLDDGPADGQEALALCRALVSDGVRAVAATPHQLGRYDGRYRADDIRQAVAQLRATLLEAQVPLTVLAGADVRIDERIPDLVAGGQIVTIGDRRRHLLLELPHDIFVDPVPLFDRLASIGIVAVITHPERHPFLARHPDYVERWTEYGPCLQITAASLTGDFGTLSQEAAWAFLDAPLPALVATDAHATSWRPPRMREAYARLHQRLGRLVARMLCVENPLRILRGQEALTRTPGGMQGVMRR